MPQRKAGITELKKNRAKHMHNLDIKTDLKKTIKSYQASLQAKNKDEARSKLKLVYKKLDKAAKRNLLHANTASRRKAYYSKLLANLS